MRIESRVLPEQLPDLGDLPPLLTRLYAARGVRSARELDRSLRALLPWNLLKGIDRAVQVLRQALEQRQSILIVGDFDCDGATASAVAVLGLRALGAARVDYLVPNRFEYGYGLTPEIVEVALQRQPARLRFSEQGHCRGRGHLLCAHGPARGAARGWLVQPGPAGAEPGRAAGSGGAGDGG